MQNSLKAINHFLKVCIAPVLIIAGTGISLAIIPYLADSVC
ncbi:MAG TPA: hypothetical protein PKD30_06940 [Saprospiraceae bacterium]|nr:hypothetical protein [Saprospiraceae bacterium]HMZ41049.1 hypothetical protein [Saprospiraceae bacterium]HNE62926.1 hypothetical protein [Saprospiraceae bacterium]HNF11415.1 hypothetical protein [Saprospiraceae bacterium]HNG69937.1 hypothetical protein [Saprospiraceae bacterium]